jgi:hypothetical protein
MSTELTEGPEGASGASASKRIDDALAAILAGLGIDPANAYQGFRAEHPFPVAVRLAMRGIRVLPTRVDTKIPCIGGWPERATTDPAKLAMWQSRFNPNWSVLTGGNMILLDADGDKGLADLVELEKKLCKLPNTVKCISGRADGGCHIWLHTPYGEVEVRNQQPLPGTKIDVRGWHGHAVVAGSLHKSGKRYTWAPGCAPDEVGIAYCPPEWWEWLPKKNHQTSPVARITRSRLHVPAIKRIHDPASHLIGDGDGFGGFQDPIYKNAIRYFLKVGVSAPESIILETLREMIAEAPKMEGRDVSRYMVGSDLPRTVERAREYVKQVKGA